MKWEQPNIITEAGYEQEMPSVLATLATIQQTQNIPTKEGFPLFCRRYVHPDHQKNLVIVHGYTEFSEKYSEAVWYFYHAGYNVFVYDQRGHGYSHREIQDGKLIHISSFDRYVDDLEQVIAHQVEEYAHGLPITLFGHSMGGAVVVRYLQRFPNQVEKAVLCAPMVSPKTHKIPRLLVLREATRQGKRLGFDKRFPYSGDFNPRVAFEQTQDQSRARFRAMLNLRLKHPEYQSSAATNGWMREAVKVQDALLRKKACKSVVTPVLLLSAQNDRTVKNKYQTKLAKRLPNCQMVTIEGATHNIYSGTDGVVAFYYSQIFAFLQEE